MLEWQKRPVSHQSCNTRGERNKGKDLFPRSLGPEKPWVPKHMITPIWVWNPEYLIFSPGEWETDQMSNMFYSNWEAEVPSLKCLRLTLLLISEMVKLLSNFWAYTIPLGGTLFLLVVQTWSAKISTNLQLPWNCTQFRLRPALG